MSHYINVLALDERTVQRMVRVTLAVTGLAGLWWMRRPLNTLKSRRYVIEVGCVAAFMLLGIRAHVDPPITSASCSRSLPRE